MDELLRITDNDHVAGRTDALVTVIEYADFQCPYCARAHKALTALREQMGEDLCLVYRHLPLTHLHPYAQTAAEVAEAATAQGKFWEMHDVLFENQDLFDPDELDEIAGEAGLDAAGLQEDVQSGRYRERVEADAQAAKRMGAFKTPTFFINGQHFQGDSDMDSLAQALEAARNGRPA
ncbi:MAG TPA: thioredoxin domain-containing protein [Telluria sp.]|nr:thioredoxin domain-containing protein [Telluria sp.]